jgi:hypothetical protein
MIRIAGKLGSLFGTDRLYSVVAFLGAERAQLVETSLQGQERHRG